VIGIYLHVPYCTVRCSYCDFYLVPARGRDLRRYGDALCAEIRTVAPELGGEAADSVHFGGGTPSVLPAEILERLLTTIRGNIGVSPGAEIALEANPEDLDQPRLAGLRRIGIGRLAIGVQSLDDRILKLMRRPHSAKQALAAVTMARRSGIASIGVDLILGLPGQTRAAAAGDLERIIDLGVDHLSVYLLELHERTRLGREVKLGRETLLPDDDAADLFEMAADRLVSRGFEQYEISNFARPGHRSRHNLKYWTDQDYLGLGPSAHSYIGGRRWWNAPDLRAYLEAGGQGHERREERCSAVARGGEALCAGLRLAEGVDLDRLRRRYGEALPAAGHPAVLELCEAGLATLAGCRLALTRRGRMVSNEVIERLMPAEGSPAPGFS
jgi:oxygen-independent coproporphyrinogen-3 oxidase